MPAKRKGARVLEPIYIAARDRWRVVSYSDAGRPSAAEIDDDGRPLDKAGAWALYKKLAADLRSLGELTVAVAIARYLQRYLLGEQRNRSNSVEEAERQLRSFFSAVLKARLRSLTPERCRRLYRGHYADDGTLLEHGSCTKPKKGGLDKEGAIAAGLPHTDDGECRAVATCQNELKAAVAFLNWCVDEDYLEANPAEEVKLVGKRRKGKTKLSAEQTAAFLDAAMDLGEQGDVGAVAVALQLVLGMRSGEVTGLVRRAVDEDFSLVRVLRGKTDPSLRALRIPLQTGIGAFLQRCLRELCKGKGADDLVFVSERGGRRSRAWMWDATHRVCAAAGVTEISNHGLRGTHLSLAEEEGATAEAMVRAAGNSRQVQRGHYLAPGSSERGTQKRFLERARLELAKDGRRPVQPIRWRQRGVRVKGTGS